MKKNKLKFINKHKIKFIILLIIIAVLIFAYFVYANSYQNKAINGLSFANYNLSGRSQEEIESLISKEVEKYNSTGLVFYYNNKKAVLTPTVFSFEPDLAYPILSFKIKETAQEAINYGKSASILKNIKQSLNALVNGKVINLLYELEDQKTKELLQDYYKDQEFPAQDAKLLIELSEDQKPTISIVKEETGKVIDYDEGIKQLKKDLQLAKDIEIKLSDKTDYPDIYSNKAKTATGEAQTLMELSPISLKHENREWLAGQEDFAKWLRLKKIDNDNVITTINEKAVEEFLNKEIAPNIDKEPVKADFVIEDTKVTKFQLAEKGLKLDLDASRDKIIKSLNQEKNNEIELIVTDINYESSNNLNLGIKEIIGTGHSNFAGSPSNRRHNIRVGAESLNGLLIKPNQEFSLVQALGDIDAASGYLPELVIKGNKTIPEYGGGLCQIGTTVFRTAIDTGLPITERRNHSYRVSYYEPAGTDATIYSPKPDFRFLNDTPNHLMIQYRIEGNDLYFDFWGTNDGRQATSTYPVIYNITPPPPTKYIETEDLEPDEVKCTERAHNGADAYFDYKVIYPETDTSSSTEKILEERFYSHYIPWQEVCLIGKKESPEQTATSTEPVTLEEEEVDNSENN